MKKTRFLLITTAIILLISCGCLFKPKTVEPIKKDNASTTAKTMLSAGCERPYSKIGDECCRDENDNGICDLDESQDTLETMPEIERTTIAKQATSTLKTTTTTNDIIPSDSTTTAPAGITTTTVAAMSDITSTTRAQANNPGQCALNADCGVAYYGSCICSNNNVVQTKYIPMCLNGTCKWRSKSETLTCRRVDSSDEFLNRTSERCVMGYGRCITNEEYGAFLTLRTNITVIDKVNMESFSKEYKGYSFRNKKAGYRESESKCYESIYFTLEVKNPAGEISDIEVSWDKYATAGSIRVKVGSIAKDDKGKDNPVLWIYEA